MERVFALIAMAQVHIVFTGLARLVHVFARHAMELDGGRAIHEGRREAGAGVIPQTGRGEAARAPLFHC